MIRRFALLALAAALAACQGMGRVSLIEHLDEASGATVRSEREPLVFARTEGRYSRSARDYLYIGPIETNRQGRRDYYLWIGIATTLDRGYLAPPLEVPDTLYIMVRGELMELELRPWSERAPELRLGDVYSTAVEVQAELAARVTLHQLAILAEEPLLALDIGRERRGTLRYFRWDTGETWLGFVRGAAEAESATVP